MKKLKIGFTLAELLIVLGIIGVISAILLPNILKSKPDETKATYITCYNTLKKIVRIAANDRQNFPGGIVREVDAENGVIHNYNYDKVPFIQPSAGVTLCDYIANYMDIEDNRCMGGFPADPMANWQPSFIKNGVEWFVTTDPIRLPDKTTYRTDVYIDVNGSKGDNCIFGNNCPNPDRFKFTISASGQLVPADAKGASYVATEHNWFKNSSEVDPNWNPDDIEVDVDMDDIDNPTCSEKCKLYNPDTGRCDLVNMEAPECNLCPDSVVCNGENEMKYNANSEACYCDCILGYTRNYGDGKCYIWDDIGNINLRETYYVSGGVYSEVHNINRPSGDYKEQRHYYKDTERQKWILIPDVYFVTSDGQGYYNGSYSPAGANAGATDSNSYVIDVKKYIEEYKKNPNDSKYITKQDVDKQDQENLKSK